MDGPTPRELGSVRLPVLTDGTNGPAVRRVANRVADAEPVALASLPDRDLAAYDAVWWHREEPLAMGSWSLLAPGEGEPDRTVPDDADLFAPVRETLRAFVADGGGLLLSAHALTAVPALGIDAVGPDAVGCDEPEHPTGYLPTAVSHDHPLFDGFDDRVTVAGPGVLAPFARYEAVLPDRGAVLAAAHYGDEDDYHGKVAVEWRVGDGAVFGLGVVSRRGRRLRPPAPPAPPQRRDGARSRRRVAIRGPLGGRRRRLRHCRPRDGRRHR